MLDYLRDGRLRWLPVAAIAVLALAGCVAAPTSTPAATPEVAVTPTPEPVSPTPEDEPAATELAVTPSVPPTGTPEPTLTLPPAAVPARQTPATPPLSTNPAVLLLTNVARADLARRLSVAEGAVVVLSAEETEMPAGSLGCTETDGPANQGIVMGTEIVLSAGGQEYIYRAGNARLVPCFPADFPGGRAPIFVTGAGLPRTRDLPQGGMPRRTVLPPDGPPATGQRQPAVASALADLAARLKIGEGQIAVKSVEVVDWPDASLGCAQRGRMYAQVITPGYRILLEAGGKVYEYHASQTHAVLCSR